MNLIIIELNISKLISVVKDTTEITLKENCIKSLYNIS